MRARALDASQGKFVIPLRAGDQRANDCDRRDAGRTAQRVGQETNGERGEKEEEGETRLFVGFSLHSAETRPSQITRRYL